MFREYFTTREAYNLLKEYGTSEMGDKVDALIDDFINYLNDLFKTNPSEYKKIAKNISSGYSGAEWEIRTTDPEDEDFKSNHGFKKIKLGKKNENGTVTDELELTLFDDLSLEDMLKQTLKGAKVQLIRYNTAASEASPFKYNLDIDMLYIEKVDQETSKYVTTCGTLFGGKTETKKEITLTNEEQNEN